jgi:hypothetical protein
MKTVCVLFFCFLFFVKQQKMLSSTQLCLGARYGRILPLRPWVSPKGKLNKGSERSMYFEKAFWERVMNEDRHRTSFWVSDFKHKYLIRTGKYYSGKVPESPPPGYLADTHDVRKFLGNHPAPPKRETRHLPVMPLTPRVVFEHSEEAEDAYFVARDKYRRMLQETRELEFHNWYTRLQRVRGRWCREQGVTSRGAYGPAVDASEIWG